MTDIINKPSHYARWAIEPIVFIENNGFEFWRGNIIKYASRAGHKGSPLDEIDDLKKVIRYAQMRINVVAGRGVLDDE